MIDISVVTCVYPIEMSRHHLRLLHVSDAAGPSAALPERRRPWDDWPHHLDPLQGQAGVDLVCYTGDRLGRGPGEEAEPPLAAGFLAPLLDRLGLSRKRLFFIPSARPLDSLPVAGNAPCSSCGFRQEVRLERLPFPVQVIALDAVGPPGGAPDDDGPQSAAAEIERLTAGTRGKVLPGFLVGLIRQRLTGLGERTAAALRLADRVDLLLSGGGAAIDIAHGAAWRGGESDRAGRAGRSFACQVITVTCDAAGRPERVIMRLRPPAPPVARRRG